MNGELDELYTGLPDWRTRWRWFMRGGRRQMRRRRPLDADLDDHPEGWGGGGVLGEPCLEPSAEGKDRSWRMRVLLHAGEGTGDAALFAGAILPQLLESTVLQDVDVTDLQPGLGRDLLGRPALDIPAVDDVRLALVRASSRPAAPLRGWIPAPEVPLMRKGHPDQPHSLPLRCHFRLT